MTMTESDAQTSGLPADLPTGLLIGGREVDGHAERIPVTNPATGEVFAHVSGADADDVDAAVRNGEQVFRSGVWRDLPTQDRARALNRFADGIEARMDDLYRLETMNNGRPITETKAQI